MSTPDPFVVSLSNHVGPNHVLRQAQDERCWECATFAAGAARLAGLAPRLLGWRPDDFWCATPAELAAILTPDTSHAGLAPLSRAELDKLMEQDRDG